MAHTVNTNRPLLSSTVHRTSFDPDNNRLYKPLTDKQVVLLMHNQFFIYKYNCYVYNIISWPKNTKLTDSP